MTHANARWLRFAIVSAFFFLITASTFASLGVALPFMIAEMSWSWSEAGIGFSLLALMVGLAGTLPAWTMRNLGIKATYGAGGALMAVGFVLLALTQGLYQYYVAVALLGVGYASCSTVPGIHVITNWLADKRSAAIGAYMTIGGLGAVAGPLIVTGTVEGVGSWRAHWWAMCAAISLLSLIAVAFVTGKPETGAAAGSEGSEEKSSDRVFRTKIEWQFRDVVRTPQYYVIVASLSMTLLCTLTMNNWAFTHMTTLGVSTALAAGALSADGAVNALSRAVGGLIATRIDPKWLLVVALMGEAVGMVALSVADNPVAIALFAIGEGTGFGLCFFATTMLLVNYFGTADNPEILGTMNTITTVAMIGPVLAGAVADTFGGFASVYQGYAVVLLGLVATVALMRPPQSAAIAAPAD